MDEHIIREINHLKEDILRQKETLIPIEELVKHPIDRDFPVDPWELSDRELDNEMGNRLSFMNEDIDTRPVLDTLSSHRRFIGRFIVYLKRRFMKMIRFYTDTLTEKQVRFNSQLVAFHLATFIRLRRTEERISTIEKQVKNLEEENELLREQINQLKTRWDNGIKTHDSQR